MNIASGSLAVENESDGRDGRKNCPALNGPKADYFGRLDRLPSPEKEDRMKEIVIGTFNLNNMFSRYNFKGTVQEPKPGEPPLMAYQKDDWYRKYMGKLVKGKKPEDTARLAQRILAQAPDVLAVQEVEDKDVLKYFNDEYLNKQYPWRVLVEGNDARFIDVGLLSKLPLGEVRSYQHWRHPDYKPGPVFCRDLIQVEVLSEDRKQRLCWMFVTHLKSKYVGWQDKKDPQKAAQDEKNSDDHRRMEAESIARIISSRTGAGEDFFLCGDFNDTPDSEQLKPLMSDKQGGLGLVNLAEKIADPAERWTETHDPEKGQAREFEQIDYILAPEKTAKKVSATLIDRRATGKTKPDGSDHDPVYCKFKI
jgi:endonuclease/exonuclease/phosphatase family metal-dependent hydrolase